MKTNASKMKRHREECKERKGEPSPDVHYPDTVSYTHLDVYKRQVTSINNSENMTVTAKEGKVQVKKFGIFGYYTNGRIRKQQNRLKHELCNKNARISMVKETLNNKRKSQLYNSIDLKMRKNNAMCEVCCYKDATHGRKGEG